MAAIPAEEQDTTFTVTEEEPSTSKDIAKSQSKPEVHKEAGGGDVSDSEEDDEFSYSSTSTQYVSMNSSGMPSELHLEPAEVVTQQRGFSRGAGQKFKTNQRGQKRSMNNRRKFGKVKKKYQRNVAAKQRRLPMTRLQKESAYSILSTRDCPCSPLTCPHCGHRCCLKRYTPKRTRSRMDEYGFCMQCRRELIKMASNSCKRRHQRLRLPCWVQEKRKEEVAVQVGSKCLKKFPLVIKNSAAKSVGTMPMEEGGGFCEITPQMIKETMELKTKWRQAIETNVIMIHIKNNYPVNQNEMDLLAELETKLEVAVSIGLVECDEQGRWLLKSSLDRSRKLSKNHVTLFWKKYRDLLKPVAKRLYNTADDHQEESSLQPELYDHMYL